ncbi:KGK domain-containing protein [Cylindrospermum sp. FACHB-282]|uniref:KGK domain-containing protein n=1 Tax=Cylindrospermum sp. FACHB-282 TaxID=2692794 RepID=UPI0016841C31|nr:KGK domain-containing protein [Cylindrospermum sp. FACHB-282]MBD2387679.1 KGK domain protein [Cylindrospermum sp. FACHB-282]
MEDNLSLEKCGDDDVISFKDKLFKLGRFRDTVNHAFIQEFGHTLNGTFEERNLPVPNTQELLGDGLDCEVLKIASQGWQKGKLRIKVTLEFIPDEPEIEQETEITEPESPLDDLRRMMNEEG